MAGNTIGQLFRVTTFGESHGIALGCIVDGVPPGIHHIRAWHPMLGTADGTVTVTPNGTATVNLEFH